MINIEEYKQKIFNKLEPSGWGRILKPFIFSIEFEKILLNLQSLSQNGQRFTPPLKDVFRAFEECPYDELKVIIVGQDPYPHLGVADGIAFSCSKTMKEQPSLRFIFNAIEEDFPHRYERDCDLSRWSKQGILMLNTAFTTEVSKIGQHFDIWAPLAAYIFDYLKNFNPGLVYIYMGKKSQDWADMCGENCTKFMVSHPASAAYSGGKWNSEGVFTKVKDLVKELYDYTIHW
jgi:uracil-DNA glycosylase